MEEEVDLRDYINVLVKWKWLIIWITVISMLVAGVYSYFISPEIYKGSSILELPYISNNPTSSNISSNPNEIVNFINSGNFLKAISKDCKIPILQLRSSLSVSPIKDTKTLSVTFENPSKDNIRKVFTDLMIKLQSSQYGILYNNKKEFLINYKNSLQSQIQENEKILYSVKKVIQLINQKIPPNDVNSFLLYSKDLSKYYELSSKQDVLMNKLIIIESTLNDAHDFNYITGVYIGNKPVKPKKLFNIAVAGTAGFFFAILLAFFLEYMQGDEDKKRIEKTAGDSNK